MEDHPRRRRLLSNHQAPPRPHLAEGYDFVIVHDPQPAAIAGLAHHRGSRWIWRCHIDTSHPHPAIWDFLECADALFHLLRHPQVAHALGESGRERVRQHFLMPRLLLDELRLLEALTEDRQREDPHPNPLPEGEGASTVG